MAVFAAIALTAIVAGLVQAVTGFGAGIVLMVVLPQFFTVVQGAGISQSICLVLVLSMAWHYRAHINFKLVLPPAILFVVISYTALQFAQMVPQNLMKLLLGVFLVLLAGYFLFIKKGETGRLSLPAQIGCVVVSALCDGLFGIGGPLMVVYYLSCTEDTDEYLGTLQAFFALCTVCNVCVRIANGVLVASMLPVILAGMAGVVAGMLVGNRVVARLKPDAIRQATYIVIGLAGAYNALSAALALL